MLGAGTFINPLLKVVTTVAVLAAVYFFIVAPILDTTEEVSRGINDNIRQAQEQSRQAFSEAQIDATRTGIASYIASVSSSWPDAAREIRSCARQAGDDGIKLQRCEEFAQGIAHGTLSDRNFATSYATSLASQGNSAAAARIERCVDRAGFRPGPMQRCRDLADRLLFG